MASSEIKNRGIVNDSKVNSLTYSGKKIINPKNNRVGYHVNTTQTLTNGVKTPINFNAIFLGNSNTLLDNSFHNTHFIAQKEGTYSFALNCYFNTDGTQTGYRQIDLEVTALALSPTVGLNSATLLPNGSVEDAAQLFIIEHLSPGDRVDWYATQTSGGDLNLRIRTDINITLL